MNLSEILANLPSFIPVYGAAIADEFIASYGLNQQEQQRLHDLLGENPSLVDPTSPFWTTFRTRLSTWSSLPRDGRLAVEINGSDFKIVFSEKSAESGYYIYALAVGEYLYHSVKVNGLNPAPYKFVANLLDGSINPRISPMELEYIAASPDLDLGSVHVSPPMPVPIALSSGNSVLQRISFAPGGEATQVLTADNSRRGDMFTSKTKNLIDGRIADWIVSRLYTRYGSIGESELIQRALNAGILQASYSSNHGETWTAVALQGREFSFEVTTSKQYDHILVKVGFNDSIQAESEVLSLPYRFDDSVPSVSVSKVRYQYFDKATGLYADAETRLSGEKTAIGRELDAVILELAAPIPLNVYPVVRLHGIADKYGIEPPLLSIPYTIDQTRGQITVSAEHLDVWSGYGFNKGARAEAKFDLYFANMGVYTPIVRTFDLLSGQVLTGDQFRTGTDDSDELHTYDGNDYIQALTGNDAIHSGAGDDYIECGAGNDLAAGENGRDDLYGGAGADKLYGGEGDDYVVGGDGSDQLYGGFGNDILIGGDGRDVLIGGAGDDTYVLDDPFDIIQDSGLETDNDTVIVRYQISSYRLTGGVKNADISGNSYVTSLIGSNDDNRLIGNNSGDLIDGGAGNDVIAGGSGNDILKGGIGSDEVDYSNSDQDISLNLGTGVASGADIGKDQVAGFERATLGAGDDTAIGSALADTIAGGFGADAISGGDGHDGLSGGDGNDTLLGGDGNDSLFGGVGNDLLTGGRGMDIFTIDAGVDTVTDLSIGDVFVVGDGATLNVTLGSSYVATAACRNAGTANFMTSGYAINLSQCQGPNGFNVVNIGPGTSIIGNAGSNVLTGGTGNDQIAGGDGNDTLIGGDGNDSLNGGSGDDVLTGGKGNDSFVIDAGIDTVTDLSPGDVFIVASGATLNATVSANYVASNVSRNAGTANFTTNGFAVDLSLCQGPNGFNVVNTGAATTLIGNIGVNVLTGGNGNDVISGGDGNDTLSGGEGNDRLTGGKGNDVLTGGKGSDVFTIDSGVDAITDVSTGDSFTIAAGATLNATLTSNYTATSASRNAGTANFFTNGFAVDLSLCQGPNGFNVLNTGVGTTIIGNAGANVLTGGIENDLLFGGEGNDTLLGGDGNDLLQGGKGNDLLTGLAGSDVFLFTTWGATHADRIADFSSEQLDVIKIDKKAFAINGSPTASALFATFDSSKVKLETATTLFVYDTFNGRLFFNQNGAAAGFGSGGLIASLDNFRTSVLASIELV